MSRHCLALLLAALCLSAAGANAQQTPPIAPKVQETPVPPPVVVPGPPTIPADVPIRPLSADEAARIALLHQPTITVAQAGITAAQGRTQQARSFLYPTLGVNGGYTHVDILSAPSGASGTATAPGGSVAGWQATAAVRQLIFDFNHTLDQVRQSQADERAAAQNLSRVQSDLVLTVKQAFYTLVQEQNLVVVSEENLRNSQAQLDLAQARLRSGLGLPSDVVRGETAVAEAVTNLTLARQNADQARVNLALQMGIDPRTPIQPAATTEPAVTTPNLQALVSQALKQRPEILQALANIQAFGYAVNVARTTNAPSFAANLGLGTRGPNFPPDTDTFSIGVSVTWTPFDSGLTAGRVKEAKANLVAAQAQLTSTQLTVTSDVSQAYISLLSAERRIQSTNSDVANGEEGVRIAEGRFRSGLGLFLDIIDAQTALVTARTNQVSAQSAVQQALAALAHAIAAPLPR